MEEIKVGYIHIPIAFNSYSIKENKINEIKKTESISKEDFLVLEGCLIISLIICIIFSWLLNKLIKN